MAENIPAANAVWRLKKAEDGSIFGPVSLETLKEWADSAQIAPDDHIDQSDDQWQPAPQTPFLEMVWEVTLESGQPYGPTTGGTLAEFLKEGLVTPKTEVTHATTGESKLLGAMAIDASSSAARPSAPEPAAVSSNISPEDLAPANPSRPGMVGAD